MVSRISTFQVVGGVATCVGLAAASGAIALAGAALATKLLPIALAAFGIGFILGRDAGSEAPLMACIPFGIGIGMLPAMGLYGAMAQGMAFAAAVKLGLLCAAGSISITSFIFTPLALGIYLRNLGRA
ncbi:MAG: hypothetical protein ACOYKZ_07320 [Chlamydiia bacterium]